MAEFAQTNIPAPGLMGVDWEQRVDFNRLRNYRVARVREALENSELGGLLLFETSNIRYTTSTHIGYWAFNKLERYALITRTGEPRIWDFGSAAKAHRLQAPWLDPTHSKGGNTGLQGSIAPDAGLSKRAALEIESVLAEEGVGDMPLGVDIIEIPVLFELQAAAMVDGVYQRIYEELKPGIRESDVVAMANETLFKMGSEYVEAINSIAA